VGRAGAYGERRVRALKSIVLLGVLVLAACDATTFLGSVDCLTAGDCQAPATVCGPDGRCIPGCGPEPAECIAGSACDAQSGECMGGGDVGRSCADDSACGPPDLVCQPSTHTCVAGCTLSGVCPTNEGCVPTTGHCCNPKDPSCVIPPMPTPANECNADAECSDAPANICLRGKCVPGCSNGLSCSPPLTCDAATGHCTTPTCARDTDCDDGSYCTQAGACAVLAYGGASTCAGGTPVSYKCAVDDTVAALTSCVGAPGPSGCPYCIDNACFTLGLCETIDDCHGGSGCANGFCVATPPACATTVPIADVVAGTYAAGKELCVSGKVTSVDNGYDGMIEIRLGDTPYLYVDVIPVYKALGVVKIPDAGDMVTVHGTARWDAGHADWELLPVDFISSP
jgi:hypothetical protein